MMKLPNCLRCWHRLSSCAYFERWAAVVEPWCFALACGLLVTAFIGGLFMAPSDYQQRDAFRIIYVHVPCAVMAMAIYVSMAVAGFIYYIWHIKLAAYYCRSIAILGAAFTFWALLTGMLWGQPMWGTFWLWGDARLMSVLILLFLYLGYVALISAMGDKPLADKAGSIVLMVGVINIPIIHFSVVWWTSLHQGATLLRLSQPAMPMSMLWPLLLSLLGFALFSAGYALASVQVKIALAKYKCLMIEQMHRD